MVKRHSNSRIVENKGLARLQGFCANHKPQISWRPVTNDDIGIDGEIELYDNEGHPLAEILKVQLKSTESHGSYIKNENPVENTFTFYAERSHVEYWQELANEVLLVIYDNRANQNALYAKKVENIDLRNVGKTYVPVQFHKEKHFLDDAANDFLQRFSRKHNTFYPTIKADSEGSETLYTNLLRINFPKNKIYLAPLNYNREDVIRDSWQTDRPLSHKATAADVAWKALNQKGLNFSADWTIYGNQLITFHDLNDQSLAISQIVEAPIEDLTPEEFYTLGDDYKRVFKSLVKLGVQQTLYKRGYEWRREEELFRFRAPDSLTDGLKERRSWKVEKRATRTVFKAKYYEKNKVFYCQHFAFSIDVKDFDNEWFLCINPTWTVSINGKQKSKVAHKTVKAMKGLERNRSVFNHLRFIAYELRFVNLYTPAYRFIDFHDLVTEQTNRVIDDAEWLRTESAEDAEILSDVEEMQERLDENLLF